MNVEETEVRIDIDFHKRWLFRTTGNRQSIYNILKEKAVAKNSNYKEFEKDLSVLSEEVKKKFGILEDENVDLVYYEEHSDGNFYFFVSDKTNVEHCRCTCYIELQNFDKNDFNTKITSTLKRIQNCFKFYTYLKWKSTVEFYLYHGQNIHKVKKDHWKPDMKRIFRTALIAGVSTFGVYILYSKAFTQSTADIVVKTFSVLLSALILDYVYYYSNGFKITINLPDSEFKPLDKGFQKIKNDLQKTEDRAAEMNSKVEIR